MQKQDPGTREGRELPGDVVKRFYVKFKTDENIVLNIDDDQSGVEDCQCRRDENLRDVNI